MANPFAGKLVTLTLRSGETYNATIVHVDSVTSALTVQREDTLETLQIFRDQLADVRLAAKAAGPAAPAPVLTPTPKKKRAPRKVPAPESTTPASYMGEFDYTKSTQGFDKKKAWEEIRQSQSNQSDEQLLVKLNRRQPNETRQPMLAPTEMVLSEPERAEEDTRTHALQREVAQLTEQLQAAKARTALLEALTGAQIRDADEGAMACTLFADPRLATAHWRAKYLDETPIEDPTGTLSYCMRLPDLYALSKDDPVYLSYLGPTPASDPAALQSLPEHFQSAVSVKLENAALFQQRLQSNTHSIS